MGSLLLILWGGMYMCMWDVMSWNLAFFVINVVQLFYYGRHEYPVKIDPELENLYQFFKPFKLPKKMFKEMVSSARITTLSKGATYAEEYRSPCNQKLSILLSGRMKVNCESLFLHYIEVNQYVDSPEYEAYQPDLEEQGNYQVTITAVEDCRLLTWNPHDFCAYLKSQPFAKALMTNLMGKDITVKLYQVQELLRHPLNEEDERKRSSSDNMSPLLQPRPTPTFRNSISIPNIPTNSYHHTKHRFSINDITGHTYKPCKQPWDTWDYTTNERVKDKCDHLKPSNYHSAFREEKPSYFNVYYKQACRDT
ncbi:popeye domain-containing protein 1-like [Tubulanus polymorphus]|uniref:popeye domain-containing protein 1-like n=1 Tax=Tubulanus polymorphus TaxID=672921 RepID=UPI003DA53A05